MAHSLALHGVGGKLGVVSRAWRCRRNPFGARNPRETVQPLSLHAPVLLVAPGFKGPSAFGARSEPDRGDDPTGGHGGGLKPRAKAVEQFSRGGVVLRLLWAGVGKRAGPFCGDDMPSMHGPGRSRGQAGKTGGKERTLG